jgi:DNA-binding NarL/FixJ family response regulator
MSTVRVLVVEDFLPFREFIRSTLAKSPQLQIIAEVSDGFEGVQKADELKPDLILLDIGLPTLNGIEAARRIRKLSPDSKIIFLSQEFAADVIETAVGLGALGYILKTRAAHDLMPAVQAVIADKQFVSCV